MNDAEKRFFNAYVLSMASNPCPSPDTIYLGAWDSLQFNENWDQKEIQKFLKPYGTYKGSYEGYEPPVLTDAFYKALDKIGYDVDEMALNYLNINRMYGEPTSKELKETMKWAGFPKKSIQYAFKKVGLAY